MQTYSDEELRATVQAVKEHGSQKAAAAALGLTTQSRVADRMAEAKKRGLYRDPTGSIEVLETVETKLPERGKIKRYILTCAQNNTRLFKPAWDNLLGLAAHYDAKLMVSTFKYNKDAMGQRAASKWESREQEIAANYPGEIRPYVCDDRVALAPNLTFCGELNVLPTAVNPLEGLESYTYRQSTIVPHPKLALESVPTMKGEGVKLMFTTGCITQRNYIKRKVGYKAEHFHSYGALLVEIDDTGSWWCRHLVHGPDGAIFDLDTRTKDGKVTAGHRVQDICWGDVHTTKVDLGVADISWGSRPDSMLETLRPHTQHVHDVLDFGARSHHTRKDPHEVFRRHMRGEWCVTKELKATAAMIWTGFARPWCETFIVNSNHDRHLERWLKEIDWRSDPANAIAILRLNLEYLEAIERDDKTFNLVKHALVGVGRPDGLTAQDIKNSNTYFNAKRPVFFLAEDQSHVILPDIEGGIEAGLHCDRGANGAKGCVAAIARVDRKVNGADKHTTAIMNHAYFAGCSCLLDMGWNHGLSSWTHAHTITYPNATRTILSVWKGKWRA